MKILKKENIKLKNKLMWISGTQYPYIDLFLFMIGKSQFFAHFFVNLIGRRQKTIYIDVGKKFRNTKPKQILLLKFFFLFSRKLHFLTFSFWVRCGTSGWKEGAYEQRGRKFSLIKLFWSCHTFLYNEKLLLLMGVIDEFFVRTGSLYIFPTWRIFFFSFFWIFAK